jgi:uridine kinase
MDRPYIVGIGGGPCSGKATLAKLIKEKVGFEAVIVKLNDFLKPPRKASIKDASDEEEEIVNIDSHYDFDHPQSIEWLMLIEKINMLR